MEMDGQKLGLKLLPCGVNSSELYFPSSGTWGQQCWEVIVKTK